MDNWSILGIPPTHDLRAIRRAYAAQSKLHHPETDPEGFQTLYAAYQWALERAKSHKPQAERQPGNKTLNKSVAKYGTPSNPQKRKPRPRFPSFPPESFQLPPPAARPVDPNGIDFDAIFDAARQEQREKYQNCAAFQTFTRMFLDAKKRDSRGYWTPYFLSEPFLSMQYDPGFLHFLVDYLETQRELSPRLLPRLLCAELYAAYSLEASQALPNGLNSMHPLVRLLESQQEHAQILRLLTQKDFPSRQAAFRIYNQLLALFSSGWMQRSSEELRKSVEKILQYTNFPKLHANLDGIRMVDRSPEFFILLARFVTSHPNLPDEVLNSLFTLYDFAHYERSSAKKDMRPLYLALRERLDGASEAARRQRAEQGELARRAYFAFYELKERLAGSAGQQEIDAFFSSELFLQAQYTEKLLDKLLFFFQTTRDIPDGLRAATLAAYRNGRSDPRAAQLVARLQALSCRPDGI